MKNLVKYLVGIAIILAIIFWLISPKPSIVKGTINGLDKAEICFANDNSLDSIKTNSKGSFSYKLKVKKGEPQFVYVYYKYKLIASLILQHGEKCVLNADTLGNYTVSGSIESEKLLKIQKSHDAFMAKLSDDSSQLSSLEDDSQEAAEIKHKAAQDYINYYRDRVKYILNNTHSISTISVVYQQVGKDLPLLSQLTDVFLMKALGDSLSHVYPKSIHVKRFLSDVKNKENALELHNKLSEAKVIGFPDIEMPDINGKKIKLSDIKDKVVMLYFWNSDPAQKMFNLDVIEPIYEQYHKKGFEIYAVSLDTDKALWAGTVKTQKLPWVNVCDGLGFSSPAVQTYAVKSVPVSFIIQDGVMLNNFAIKDANSLKKYLQKELK